MTQEEFRARFLAQMNEQQKEAVLSPERAILLLAVPGSGKTTVLVTRLGYMVCCRQVDPRSILTVTYTVAATREMKQRFAALFGEAYARDMEFRTINGLSARIIDYYARQKGETWPYRLLESEGEVTQLLRELCLQVNREYPQDSTVKDLRTAITYIKNMQLTRAEIEALDTGVEHLPELYAGYCEELQRRGAMDYDDQMVYALRILRRDPTVLAALQNRFRCLCVDEAQDTSRLQHEIIGLIASRSHSLFMVGDEDQSIYGFRAAYPDALLNFEATWPGGRVLLMEHNYRSTPEIVGAANAFVQRNRSRRKKSILPTRPSGSPVRVVSVESRDAQYHFLFRAVRDCSVRTAILFRNNDSAVPLIDCFDREGIPFRCRSFDKVFFSHRVIVDIRDIIFFSTHPTDTDCFLRIYYKFSRGISREAAQAACRKSEESGRAVLTELQYLPGLRPYVREAAKELTEQLAQLPADEGETAICRIWYGLHYGRYAEERKLDTGKREILCLLARQVPNAEALVWRLDELQELTSCRPQSPDAPLTLSTIHSSKGLEYDRVFLLDVLDGILPSLSEQSAKEQGLEAQYEEERRIYYVGITRARNELVLFRVANAPSAFTREILAALPSSSPGSAGPRRSPPPGSAPQKGQGRSLSPGELSDRLRSIRVGSSVIHKSFGAGSVESIEGNLISVFFPGEGRTVRLIYPGCIRNGLLLPAE